MRQQLSDLAALVRRQSSQYIFQINIRIISIELATLGQAHDCSRTLTRPQEPSK